MKKLICVCLILAMCGALLSCKSLLYSTSPLPDISPKEVEEKQVQVPGEVYSLQKYNDGLLLQYQKPEQNLTECCLGFWNENGTILWEWEISPTFDSLHLFGEEGIFLRTNSGFSFLNQDGSLLWEIEKFDGYMEMNVALPDHAGGVYLLGRDTVYHIDRHGQLATREPFEDMENLSALSGWPGADSGYWILGTRSDRDERFLAHVGADFRVIQTFELFEQQYPTVVFLPEENWILLYGQAYTVDSHKEYGFLYEIDYDCNQKQYMEFGRYVPRSAIRLKDGRWLVSSSNRARVADRVTLFSSDWKKSSTVPVKYWGTELFALDDGGFAIVGDRLSPGQPYEALFMSSFTRHQVDLVYERFNAAGKLTCRKTYSAESSNSGYGYRSFVDKDGKLFLF